jgi:transposase
MAPRRKFSKSFKRQVVEEFLAGGVTQGQLARRYDISPHLIIQWRKRYGEGRLTEDSGPSAKDERIKELERMVGRLTMENELLKKAVEYGLSQENESSSVISGPGSNRSDGGAK